MSRKLGFVAAVMLSLSFSTSASAWRLGEAQLIDPLGTRPSVWAGTTAYNVGNGGAIMYFDGTQSYVVFDPDEYAFEPANASGSVAFRQCEGDAGTNEIMRWDGDAITDVSDSPGINDSNLTAAGNGDLMWSANHAELMYYHAATDVTEALGVRGDSPWLYVTDEGVATYAYQDPVTFDVLYFDGATTHNLGHGATYGARPCLWDGLVAWSGEGQGAGFNTSELFVWKDGQVTRLTNDDAVGGIPDEDPTVWNNVVVWTRSPTGAIQPRLFLWDGSQIVQLTTVATRYPSLHDGQLAWVAADGLYVADLISSLGDVNGDGLTNNFDITPFVFALTHTQAQFEATYPAGCYWCADVNGDGSVNNFDITPFVHLIAGE